jgi:hypothetical protein
MLTVDEIFLVAAHSGLKPKSWGSYRLKTYNGFTHEQRVRKWQALNLAIQMGLEQKAHLSPCSICGKTGGPEVIAYHSEDYGSMTGHHTICRGCHTRAHRRFTNPQQWLEFIAPYCNGIRWFENLSTDEQAQPLRPIDPVLILEETITQTLCSPIESNTPPAKPVHTAIPKSSSNISKEMLQIRTDFTKALGLDWEENPHPNSGYKYEHSLDRRQQFLYEARRLRDLYTEMVNRTGRGKGILEKMNNNLENRDRKTTW